MFKRKPLLNYLDMTPVRNVQDFIQDDEKITLLIPKFRSRWMRDFMVPGNRSKFIRIHLDEAGSKVWQLIDGKRNVGEICTMLDGLPSREVHSNDTDQIRLTKFLSHLYRNRFIIFREK